MSGNPGSGQSIQSYILTVLLQASKTEPLTTVEKDFLIFAPAAPTMENTEWQPKEANIYTVEHYKNSA